MNKIINTLKYGDAKTKLVLVMSFLSAMASLVLFVLAIVMGQMLLFFFGVVGIFVTISLGQTLGIYQEENPMDIPEEHLLFEETKPEKEKESKAENKKKNKINNKTKKEKKSKEKIDKAPKQKKAKKQKEDNHILDNMNILLEDEINATHEAEKEDEYKGLIHPTEETISSYDKKKIKKTLHKYKVRKDHRMVLVDRCDKYNIYQTPAYIWCEDNKFHMLLIEKEPRYITLPLFNLGEIKYLKKQPANPDKDYKSIQGNSIMANLFKPYLPDYMHSNVVDDLTSYKNLYGVGPDIYFTNQSAKHLFDLVSTEFFVEDKVTTSTKVNFYFKDAYKANIMLRDSVIDANGYADMISNILENMAMSSISYNEFKETLNLMIKNKLITQEFASYYMDVRDKNFRQ